jgi:hypothetical protein
MYTTTTVVVLTVFVSLCVCVSSNCGNYANDEVNDNKEKYNDNNDTDNTYATTL